MTDMQYKTHIHSKTFENSIDIDGENYRQL